MRKEIICCPPANDALRYCSVFLTEIGLNLTEVPVKGMTHLILPVPSFTASNPLIEQVLAGLEPGITVCGGNLEHSVLPGHQVVDFLKDPYYLADNAAITAECAVQIANNQLADRLQKGRTLILGWGRIGKCLGKILQNQHIDTTIAARKDTDLAMIHALGYHAVAISQAECEAEQYQVVFNTVPEMILPNLKMHPGSIAIELASKPGMAGNNIISARGLPGKMAPEKSGELIARTFIRLALKKEW